MKRSLLLFLLLTFAILQLHAQEGSGVPVVFEKTLTAADGQTLIVEAAGADVKIESWSKNEVYVKMYGNETAVEKLTFSAEKAENEIKVMAKRKEGGWGWNANGLKLLIEVKVPAKFATNVTTSGGDIYVTSLEGKNNLSTSGGDIRVKSVKGNLIAKTSGGDIMLKSFSGETYASTSGGDIETENGTGTLTAETSGGDISVEHKSGKLDVSTSGGNIKMLYVGDNMGLNASTSGGDITLKVPESLKASLYLATTGGDIDCDLSYSKSTKISKSKVEAEINGGGAMIKCRTTGGDVRVITIQ